MGKFHLPARYLVGLLCAAPFAFPAVVSAGTVSVDVSPTTGYTVTNRSTVALPPRTSSGPVQTYNPTVGPLAGGGAYQTTSSGITITGVKGNTGSTTMSGRINAGAAAMRNGLARCLTSMRCNMALAGGAAGLQALLDGIGGLIENGSVVQKKGNSLDLIPDGTSHSPAITRRASEPVPDSSRGGMLLMTQFDEYNEHNGITTTWNVYCHAHAYNRPGDRLIGYQMSPYRRCYYLPGASPDDWYFTGPMPSGDLEGAIDSQYNPDPSDLPFVSGGLDFSAPDVNFEIMDIPSITGSDSPTFIENSDGTSKGTYSEFEFSWSNNPSKQPEVSVDETTTETTYSLTGEPTGTTTTTTTGSGSSANVEIEIPTDCDFMPTVCRFIDWFTEPDPELSQEPDFTQLIDVIDIERDFQVGTSTAACPAPFQISLSWVPSVEVSLQPFCDLADLLRPFLLSLCFLYSGMIILRT